MTTVEFYGIPRERAGLAALDVDAYNAVELLLALEDMCPGLGRLIGPDGALAPEYLLSLNGEEFLADLGHVLEPGDRLLLLSADAGG